MHGFSSLPAKASFLFMTALCIAGLFPAVLPAQDIVQCQTVSTDGETTIDLQITSPVPGSEDILVAPCPEELAVDGFASTVGLPVDIEVYVIIDSSGSTAAASGADVDNDNVLGTGTPSSDPDDSILAAELEAVRQFVGSLDPSVSRVAIIQFSSPEGSFGVGERQRIVQSLTDDFNLVDQALDDIFNAVPNSAGATDYGGALDLLLAEHAASHRTGAFPVSIFLSDGVPTWPQFPYNQEDPLDRQEALDGAADAKAEGIVIHTFAVGSLFFPASDTLKQVALTTGGKYFELLLPSEILDALPGTSLVGIKSVEVTNVTLSVSVTADISPDGSFSAMIPIGQGLNDIEVVAVADNDDLTELSCRSDYTLVCLNPDNCFGVNKAQAECSVAKSCIEAITLAEVDDPLSMQTFTPADFEGANTVFQVGDSTGEFHVSCSRCIQIGDQDGGLVIVDLIEDGTIAAKCDRSLGRSLKYGRAPAGEGLDEQADEQGDDEEPDRQPCKDPVNITLEGTFRFEGAGSYADADTVVFSIGGIAIVDTTFGEFLQVGTKEIFMLKLSGSGKGVFVLDFEKCRFKLKAERRVLGGLDTTTPAEVLLRVGLDLGLEDIQFIGTGKKLEFKRKPSVSCCVGNGSDEDTDEGPDEDPDEGSDEGSDEGPV